jgi:hypothetical protein
MCPERILSVGAERLNREASERGPATVVGDETHKCHWALAREGVGIRMTR